MRARAIAAPALAASLLLAATAARAAAGTGSGAPPATPRTTFHVIVGGTVKGHPQVDLQSFYPRVSVIHAGDRIEFDFRGLHTASFVPPRMPVPQPVIPAAGTYPPVNDAAGHPFWWAGKAQRLQFNSAVALPAGGTTVDGRHFVNSGVPAGAHFHVTFTFTKPGRYRIQCLIHPGMIGAVVVRPRHAVIPGPAAQRQIGKTQSALDAARALALDQVLAKRSHKFRHRVDVGDGTSRFSLMAFYPRHLTVHAGDAVTFRLRGVNEIHTVTFGPPRYVEAIAARLFPPPPPPLILDPVGALPSQPPGTRVALTATLHGNGFLTSGILADPGTAGPHLFTVRFTQPGTYRLDCLIHAGMQAVITVQARTTASPNHRS